MTAPGATPFGSALRRWRTLRGLSQLALSTAAQTPARHVSFLETGRSRPTRPMVGRLAEALDLPLRERNALLKAAGFGPDYTQSRLESEEMAPFREVIAHLLSSHEPYPAYVIDRHWNIVEANAAAGMFLPEGGERNAVRLTYAGAWRPLIANWTEIAWSGARRLEGEVGRAPHDAELAALLDVALDAVRDVPQSFEPGGERVLCPHFDLGGRIVRTMTVVAQFGAAQDVTLDELRIELVYPADAGAADFFAGLASKVDGVLPRP